jgi:hypothetical protein
MIGEPGNTFPRDPINRGTHFPETPLTFPERITAQTPLTFPERITAQTPLILFSFAGILEY